MANQEELGPLAILCKRTTGFNDSVGAKDAAGKSINLTLFDGKVLTPHGAEYFANVKSVKMRPDDILVCGYVKTGCHWIWEAVSMILKGRAEYSPFPKQLAYLEMASPECYDSLKSPRVLNTHLEYDYLPDQAKAMKTKIILTTRNPKDTAVSLYNHHINLPEMYQYDGQFKDWFPLFLDGNVDSGDFFDYHVTWEKSIREHPEHPILVVKYEESKKDLKATIRTLAKFLQVTLTEDQVASMAKLTDFPAMKQKFKGHAYEGLIRKGEVGDWKNWLTEDQAKEIDRRSKKYLTGTHFELNDHL